MNNSGFTVTAVTTTKSLTSQNKQSKWQYYWLVAKWMYKHRTEPDNRQKWRRMQREISGGD